MTWRSGLKPLARTCRRSTEESTNRTVPVAEPFRRAVVEYHRKEAPGSIMVDSDVKAFELEGSRYVDSVQTV